MSITNEMAEAALDALDDACIGFQRSRNPSASVHWKGFTRDDRVSAMRTAISAALAKQDAAIALMRGQSWQPIETAPKDGTNLLLCVKGFVPAVGKWEHGWWTYRDASEFLTEESYMEYLDETSDESWPVTHWQPLPNTPKDPADEQ